MLMNDYGANSSLILNSFYVWSVHDDRARVERLVDNGEASAWFGLLIELILYGAMCTQSLWTTTKQARDD